jgi:integrase
MWMISTCAVEIVREMLMLEKEFVFPGAQKGKPISNMTMLQLLRRMDLNVTVRGFRSSFRDWAAEKRNFSNEVCEMALAHAISDAAEAAYRRGDLFEKRRHLMQAWADFVTCIPGKDAVIRLRSAA